MKFHRNRCFGPAWPHRYAWALAYSQPKAYSQPNPEPDGEADAPGASSWYAHREYRTHDRKSSRRSGNFGVRRPLRYLSYQLDLDESQRRAIAVVLDSLKTEREQAVLDEKKMTADLADLIARPDVSTESLEDTLSARVQSARQVQTHVARALQEIARVLDPDQREEFSYLIRTGAFKV